MTAIEQWEYLTKFCTASLENPGAREFVQANFPELKKTQFYAPQTMIPELNELGKAGWELVHMEPVAEVGRNGDVKFQGGGTIAWSNVYFCVFKRRITA